MPIAGVATFAAAVDVPVVGAEPAAPAGPRPAFTILRGSSLAAAREYASLPLVRPWRELARAADPAGRLPLDTGAVWAGDVDGALSLPAQFDGRRRWGRLLAPPRDQGLSGACWAFAVVSAFGDRAALWTHGAMRAWPDGISRPGVFGGLAPRDIVDRDFDALTEAQSEAEADVVSANEVHHGARHADYGHTLVGAAEALYVGGVSCAGGWRCRPLAHYALASSAEMDVKAEIFAWGPVASAFALHEDFMYPERHPASWVGGVYRHDPAACPCAFGGHAVVLVGWCEAWLPPPPLSSSSSSPSALDESAMAHGSAAARLWRHTCWIARHAWGAGWAGGAHADGYFAMVAGQCELEANVVACVPDVAGLALDPRDAHRVAPPSAAARRHRAIVPHAPESDLIGPARVDPALLCDMGAFVAAEVYGPWDASGSRPRVGAHDGAATFADGRWPPSDAWTTTLRRAWMAAGDRATGQHWSVPRLDNARASDQWRQSSTPDAARHVAGPFDGGSCGSDQALYGGDDGAALYRPTDALASEDAYAYDDKGTDNDHNDRQRFDDLHGHFPYGSVAPDRGVDPYVDRDAYYSIDVDDGDTYSNSDAELSDDERQADARHRLLHRRRRRAGSPPV